MLLLDLGLTGLVSRHAAHMGAPQRLDFVPYVRPTSDTSVGQVIGAFFSTPPMDITYTLIDDQNSNLEINGNEVRVGGALAVGTYTLTIVASNETGWSQTILQALDIQEPVPSWIPRDYLGVPVPFVLDAQNNRGWYAGTEYSSEALFLAAPGVSGTLASGIRTFGPYDVPGAPNEFPGTADLSNTNALTAVGSGSSIASVGGELELTAGGSGTRWRFNLPLLRKAYRWRLKGRRGTNTNGQIAPASAINTGMTGGLYIGSVYFTATKSELSTVVPSSAIDQRYAGAYQANSTTGISYFNDAILTEVRPLSIFNQAEGTIVVEGVADNASSDQVLFEVANTVAGQGGDRDYIRFTRSAATGQISSSVVVSGINLWAEGANIATIASSNTVRIAISWKGVELIACINGGAPFAKGGGASIESHAIMRFAGTLTGNIWTGFHKGYYIPTQQPGWWLLHASTAFAANGIRTEGDS